MKSARIFVLVGGLFFLAFSSLVYAGVPQMINYQGKLTTPAGALIDDTLSMVFTIYDAATDGGVFWTETQATVIVEKGIFSVLLGSVNPIPDSVFPGDIRYLGVKVEADPEMTPRKEIVSVGYAYKAEYADTAAYAHVAVSDGDWTFHITDTADTTLMMGGEWGIARSGNVLHGNADSTHVNLGVACTTGTSGENRKYSTVGGGLENTATYDYATVGGGLRNIAGQKSATVGGGEDNIARAYGSTVGGGDGNRAWVSGTTVAGGALNSANDFYASVGGGYYNTASGWVATVAGGEYNSTSGNYATIPGGCADTVAGAYSLAAGHKVRIASGGNYTFAFGRNFSTSTPNAVIFHNSVNPIKVGIGTSSPHANSMLHVQHNNLYAGYFTSNYLDHNTHVIHSEFTGSGNYDAAALYGYSRPADYWGYGGYFEGGFVGVLGEVAPTGSNDYYGVCGYVYGGSGTNYGVYGDAWGGTSNWAGYFYGNAKVTGTLTKGGGSFQIDHPLDPENKYLFHSFVESPDMKNVYDGVVTLDASGQATVQLPDYFEALNRDFRYQLTCIGGFAPVYIEQKISGNQFRIAGGEPGMEVSWQVTGIRHDKFAEANRIQVEVDKPADEQGKYLHPQAYNLGQEYDIHYEQNKRMKEKEEERKLD